MSAMQIRDENGERILSLCGTILNRARLEECELCGAELGPARYREYIRKRVDHVGRNLETRDICEVCARKMQARPSVDTFPA